MKFNILVELDWIGDESNLDDDIKRRIVNEIADKINKDFTESVAKQMANTAKSLVQAKTELIINTILEGPVVISDGWNKNESYDSIFDMVETKMRELYEGKIKSASGSCDKDPLLANVERYIKTETERMLKSVKSHVEKVGKEEARKAINEHDLIKAIGVVVKK